MMSEPHERASRTRATCTVGDSGVEATRTLAYLVSSTDVPGMRRSDLRSTEVRGVWGCHLPHPRQGPAGRARARDRRFWGRGVRARNRGMTGLPARSGPEYRPETWPNS